LIEIVFFVNKDVDSLGPLLKKFVKKFETWPLFA
jgi:hypothetical protein